MEEKPIILDRKEPIPGEYGHPIPRELMLRELGYTGQFGRHSVGKRIVSQTFSTKAVHTMSTQEEFKKRSFKLPSGARTTFHMAFSADGTKVASCHGDHNVYVCDVGSGKVVQTLTGHPRTPWCVVFHPTQNDVLASGCLAGQVRVWDLKGGSETLVTDSGTVIASLAFHPSVRLLAIATFNEIIFWDWGLPYPLARCSTENTKEKVRLVRFDRLGRSLITGITNYPNPPFRESCRVQGSAFFRPNILSRGTHRTVRRPIPFPDDDMDSTVDDDPNDGHGPGPDDNLALSAAIAAADGQPSAVAEALNDRQERFQESYRQLVNHYQDLVNHYQQFLRSRIPRLLETSRVVREHPQAGTLIHMEAGDFLHPMVAVTEGASLESSPEVSNDAVTATVEVAPSAPLSPDEHEYPTTGSPEELPNSIVIDQETAGPSRLLQLENSLLEHMETEAATTLANLPNLMSNAVSPTQSTSQNVTPNRNNTSLPRRDTDLQSIEALAQNILEMQNLCTQARRDAPLTVETQHIIELQNIRHHLELLQEQTRDLQSSIRATLTSLAHGSFDALRSHIVSNVAAAVNQQAVPLSSDPIGNPNLVEVAVVADPHISSASSSESETAEIPTAPMDIEMHMHMPNAEGQPPMSPGAAHQTIATAHANAIAAHHQNISTSNNPANPVIRITISPHITTANNPVELGRLSPPGPYVYSNSPPPSRSRVPPIVTMQYDFGDGVYRSRTTTLNPGINMEPMPGPSRDMAGTSTTYQVARSTVDPITGNRRVVREFHVMGRPAPGESEHARNCPFGRDGNLARPPPRMRCLTEMGETPMLSVWPTTETGQEQATRSFQGLRRGSDMENGHVHSTTGIGNQNERAGPSYGNVNNGNASAAESTPFYQMHPLYSAAHLPSFSHWMNSGPYWVNSDVGVGVYLTVRQFNESAYMENEHQQQLGNEDWQRFFVSGLALVPPAVRQGQRHHSRRQRRTPNIIYHMGNGSSRAVPLRPSSWDEFRSNLYTSSSPTELGSLSPNSPYLAGITSAREVPVSLDGNFNRIYSMRMGDEIIPVYSSWVSSQQYSHWATPGSSTAGTAAPIELRESPQSNVYTFPIGLFLEGSFWTGGTQTIGIFWPPASREEEDSLIEYRRTETLIPVMTQEEMEIRSMDNRSNVPYRIDFDSTRLIIHVSAELWLTLIQPGLTLLDATTTMANWQRPRPTSGTVFVNQLAPFLDALERLFGHRMRRTVLPTTASLGTHSSSYFTPANSSGGATVRLSTVMHPGPLGRQFIRTSQGPSRQPRQEGNSTAEPTLSASDTNSADAAATTRRREGRANHPRRFISFANEVPLYQSNILSRYPGETLEAYRRRLYHDYLGQEAPEGGPSNTGDNQAPQPLAHFISVSRNRLGRMTRSEAEQRFNDIMSEQPEAPTEHGTNSNSTRRFIRLAVDTATAEVLRRHQSNTGPGHGSLHGAVMANPSVQSAIESRIERVLNERGNRGLAPVSPTNFAPEPNGGRHRPEELQMRINVLTQWSRHRAAMSTSGTQTPRSFLRSTTPVGESTVGESSSSTAGSAATVVETAAAPTTMQAPNVANPMNSARPVSRRRPYSRLSSCRTGAENNQNENNSDDESTPPLPPRIARMSLMTGERNENSNSIALELGPTSTTNDITATGAQENALNLNGDPTGASVPSGNLDNNVNNLSFMPFGEHWVIRRQRLMNQPVSQRTYGNGNQISFAARRVDHPTAGTGAASPGSVVPNYDLTESSARTRIVPSGGSIGAEIPVNQGPTVMESENLPSTSNTQQRQPPTLRRNLINNPGSNNVNAEDIPSPQIDASARFYPGYIPEILITPRARPPTYYTMDAATTAFLSSRIQKWDFSQFILPDITKRDESVVVRECSLHSDACLDVSSDSDFLAVLQPSDNGQYSAVGLYSLRDESLGGILYIYHFDQNTVSVSISPSCDYIVVGYAGRGPFYRFVHPSRNIGQILSLTRDGDRMKLVSVKELFADSQSSLMSINCMHWVPVPGYGIIYGTNTGELVLLS